MKIIAPPPQRFFKKLATLIMIAALSLSCVVKVKPTPYQRGLKAYYGALLSKSTQEELRLALTGLERELKLAPADVGLLSLRASTNLELLRLDVQGGGTNFSSQAALLLRDLRLLQSLIDQNGNQPPWVGARIYTMTGDVMMLRAIALGNSADICANLQASGLFRLAADYYLHAGSVARSTEAALKGKEQESLNLPAVLKEQANARDGYINGLGGLAQSEDFLRLSSRADEHLLESNALLSLSAATFPPDKQPLLTPRGLEPYSHTLLSQQSDILKNRSRDFNVALRFAEAEFKELLAAGLFTDPSSRLADCSSKTLLNYYASLSLSEMPVKINHLGEVTQEEMVFTLPENNLYRTAGIGALVPYVTITVGSESPRQIILEQSKSGNVPGFMIQATWKKLSIFTGKGENNKTPDSEGGVKIFLNQSASLFKPLNKITITGPGGNVLGTIAP